MPAQRITKRVVDAAQATTKTTFLWDGEVKGFGLKVTTAGTKTYLVQYRLGGRGTPTQRVTIGKHGSPWTPDKARERAIELLSQVSAGADPRQAEVDRERELTEGTLDKVVPLFIERYAKRHQLRSWRETERIFERDVLPVFGRRPVGDLTRRAIAAFLEERALEAPAVARLTHALMRKFFRWCVERGLIDSSPMVDMSPPSKVASRDRVLSDDELRAFWQGTQKVGEPWVRYYRLLLLLGQRREETAAMRWEDINDDIWCIPAERAKNGRAHLVYLPPAARELLGSEAVQRPRSGLVFSTNGSTPISGFSKAKRRLDDAMLAALRGTGAETRNVHLEEWRIHDLRRTMATGLQRLGVRLEVTEAVLNHVSGSRAGIVGVYQRHDYAAEKRGALIAWADHLAVLLAGNVSRESEATQSNVVYLGQVRDGAAA